ncbi:MAG: hypothetical protein CMF45_03600 [Legionellales bacterium]|nr:hypothetical protein [Legionellales bacterium]|tara:strand:+ start:2649 stop:3788 length:1140 start_codon:yes stop_codon:yes gene_type:complete
MRFYVLILFCFIYTQADCVDGRYLDDLFDVEVSYGISYGENINEEFLFGNEYTQTLYMDVYEPVGDSLDDRPVIFFMFGGSFVGGSRDSGYMVELCNRYASKGYVAVSIDYRLTPNLIFEANAQKAYEAVIKGVHDLKAAIRYFRMNDVDSNDFRIDSDRIFVGGVSAGAIASLNAVYISDENEALSLVSEDYLDSVGGLEGDSGNLGYSSEAHGIVNFCGAVGDYSWIDEGDVPIVSMHGDQDGTVPYDDSLVTLFGLNVQVFGSYTIHDTMLGLGNYSALHTYVGQDHVPFSANDMDFEIQFTSDFLYDIVCSGSDIVLGDINQDGVINVLDAVVLINYILLTDSPDSNQFFASDMNADEEINVLDVVLLVSSILQN